MLELTNTEQVIMKCIWEIGDNVAVEDLLERLKTEYGKEYAHQKTREQAQQDFEEKQEKIKKVGNV